MNKLVYAFLFIFLYSLQIPISHADTGDDILAVHSTDDFHMIIPSGWRELPINAGAIVFFLNGDGLGFPAIDDTGSPLQVGMTVEKFANHTISLEEWENRLANGFKKDPRLKLKEQKIERDITLSDGLKANLLLFEFIKSNTRQSLQMKLFTKDQKFNGWVVSAWLVGGKGSEIPRIDSGNRKFLEVFLKSFCLNKSKLNIKGTKDELNLLMK